MHRNITVLTPTAHLVRLLFGLTAKEVRSRRGMKKDARWRAVRVAVVRTSRIVRTVTLLRVLTLSRFAQNFLLRKYLVILWSIITTDLHLLPSDVIFSE